MDRSNRSAGRGVYPIIDGTDLYGARCSGPAVQAGSGLTGLAESCLIAVSLLGLLLCFKNAVGFSTAHARFCAAITKSNSPQNHVSPFPVLETQSAFHRHAR